MRLRAMAGGCVYVEDVTRVAVGFAGWFLFVACD